MNCNAKLVKHNMPRAKHNLQKAWPISGPEPEGTRHWLWAALAALQDRVPVVLPPGPGPSLVLETDASNLGWVGDPFDYPSSASSERDRSCGPSVDTPGEATAHHCSRSVSSGKRDRVSSPPNLTLRTVPLSAYRSLSGEPLTKVRQHTHGMELEERLIQAKHQRVRQAGNHSAGTRQNFLQVRTPARSKKHQRECHARGARTEIPCVFR